MSAVTHIATRVSRITGSSFVRAVAILSAGQFAGAVIPILTAPILGRLYSPADYGVLATYMAIANVLAAVSTMQLEMAILSEKSDRQAVHIVTLCRWVSLIVAGVAAILGVGLFLWTANKAAYAGSRGWMLLLPLTVLASGSTAAIRMLANRMARYRPMASNLIYSALLSAAITIPLGWLGWGANGLFMGYFSAQALTLAMYLDLYRKLVPVRCRPSPKRLLVLVRRHRDFAIFTQPSEFVGTLNQQLLTFALTGLGEASFLGAFSRARQLIVMPLNLLGASTGRVFRQRAAEQFQKSGSCLPIYRKTLITLACVGIAPTLLILLFGPWLMTFYLGAKWAIAGRVARILAPMLFLSFVTGPLANIFYFQGYQKEEFFLNAGGAALLAITLGLAAHFGKGYAVIYAYSAAFSAIYIAYLLRGWAIARNGAARRNG